MTNHALTPSSVSIEIINGQPTTTSLDVAAHFGKRHDRVLDKIRNLDCSTEFRLHNFVEASQDVPQPNGGVAKYPIFRMTRDGFTFLCMGFTGKEAAKWKEAYINAFNQMEASLLRGDSTSKRQPKALPNGLTIDQQDAIKALVRARVEATPKEKQAKAAITCWSALKSKFGCTYKQIAPDQYAEAVSLIARLPLEGEFLGRMELPAPPVPAALALNDDDLAWMYAFCLNAADLISAGEKVLPALSALSSITLLNAPSNLKNFRSAIRYLHGRFGGEMERSARQHNIYKDWGNLAHF